MARAWRFFLSRSDDLQALLYALHLAEFGRLAGTVLREVRGLCLGDAEAFVQEAFTRALARWPEEGVPRNPGGWLSRVARNAALDSVRQGRNRERLLSGGVDFAAGLESDRGVRGEGGEGGGPERLAGEIDDDVLGVVFACCHPTLSEPQRTALTLKMVFGLSNREIAAAQLGQEASVAQRIVRAQARLRKEREDFGVPAGEALAPRLDAVLRVLFLLFNEGYFSSSEEGLLRRHLCEEALRLANRLCAHPRLSRAPKVFALRALFSLHLSRFDARYDAHGEVLLLEEQDRSVWDQAMIERGLKDLEASGRGEELTPYHLHAALSAAHCVAPAFEQTDWSHVRALYDILIDVEPSPLSALARTVATSHLEGPGAALAEWEALPTDGPLPRSFLYHAAGADFRARAGRAEEAAIAFDRAESLAVGIAQVRAVRRLRSLRLAARPG